MRHYLDKAIKGMFTGAIAASFIYTSAFAGPPSRPMVISGEVLIDGTSAADGTELRMLIAQTETTVRTTKSETGTAHYRAVLSPYDPAKPDVIIFKDGDPIKFLFLGQESLADITPLAWKAGAVKKNILVRTAIDETPSVLSPSATKDADGKWILKGTVRPLAPKKDGDAALSYRVKWLVRKAADADTSETQERAIVAAEETLASISSDRESVLNYSGTLKDAERFEICVTPITPDGKNGPSARQKVYQTITKGEL